MKKYTTILCLGLLTLLCNTASAAIIPFKVTYTPTTGDAFHAFFTIDNTGVTASAVVPILTFSSVRSPNEWIQGVDSGGTNLFVGADLIGFSDATLDGQLFDDASPFGNGAILSHNAGTESFQVYIEVPNISLDILAEGTVSILQVPAPGVLALMGLGIVLLGWKRRGTV